MNDNPSLQPAAAASLALWHQMVANADMRNLSTIVAPTAVFRSPAVYKPYQGAPAMCLILNTVMTVFKEFTYHRSFVAGAGLDVVLEFSASVGDKSLKGIDMIRFDEHGKIVEFEVMIRPLSGLQALAEEMGRKLAPFLQAGKAAQA